VFGSNVAEEVEVQRVSERLVQVVSETLQPAHVTLWLKHGSGLPGEEGQPDHG
jgi:hypothetical protein